MRNSAVNSATLLRALCTGTKAPPAFYAWRVPQAARLRESLMLLTSGSESYRAADAEALSTLNWCTISRTAGYTPLVTQYTSKNNVATDKPGAAGGRGPARPSEAAHGPARAAREGPRGEESAKQAKARSRSRKRNAPSISHRGSDSTLTQK